MGIYSHWVENDIALDGLRGAYEIPEDVLIRRADPADYALRSYSGGWMPFPLIAIVEGGVRFPLDPLLRACLSTWALSPCQLSPNGYKVIMGTAVLNKSLGIDLGVHDIEDVYDICKSKEDGYYLRVRPQCTAFVTALEDSSKYAGDDLVCVSGNWEFGAEEDRVHRVPRHPGVVPTARERRRRARRDGWRKNEEWYRAIRGCTEFSNRSAWALLGYEPRYRGYNKRSTLLDPLPQGEDPGTSNPFVGGRPEAVFEEGGPSGTAAGAEASPEQQPSPEPQSSGTPLVRRARRPHIDLEEMSRVPAFVDLEALALGDEGEASPPAARASAGHLAPSPGESPGALEVAVPTREPSPEVQRPPEVACNESSSRKRPREEGGGSGRISRVAEPAPWKPNFLLEPGRPMTVDDCIHRRPDPLVLEALGHACALPRDMARLEKMSDPKLVTSLLHSCFQTLQKSMVVIDRFSKQGPLVAGLTEEKRELEEALGSSVSKINQLEAFQGDLRAKLGEVAMEIENEKMKNADLEAQMESLKSDLRAETKRADEAEAKVKTESEAAFQDAATQATVYYGAKVFRVRDKAWAKARRAALREVGISEDHPIYPGPSAPDNTVIIGPPVGVDSGPAPQEASADVPCNPVLQEP
ncbi:hypothetical protein CKAN_00360800 [Cinnamomum micranthum f. kanehirae]|uniref:Uncharacterized protein n=1 Tax=Cinnamomum micranthum f. kanehirae TaxID=337451 RepID=A0A3S3NU17_9MAGN|nr:hypothetical protein CKAN_00360800 [Cinnamomum micranthum f. kanehirae]